jgi:hypothetical protein
MNSNSNTIYIKYDNFTVVTKKKNSLLGYDAM